MAVPPSRSTPRVSLLPKEHGAYVQLCLALVSGLILAHGHPRALGQAILTVLAFLVSEPALILFGLRGSAPQDEAKTHAFRLLALLGALSILSAAVTWWHASPAQLLSLLIPTLLAASLMALALAKREHTTLGEMVGAWALSSSAYPVAILGGAGPREAGLLTLALVGIQSIGTTTVRAFLESLKRGGHPSPRVIPLLLGLLLVGLGWASGLPFSWLVAWAMVPNTGIAAWLLVAPPSPKRMKRIGWLLTLASVAGALPVVFALR
jgi:hypothetical protein